MVFFFWLFWAFDLLAALFLLWAIGFRSEWGASTGMQLWLLLLLVVVLIGGPVLRFGLRLRFLSLGVVALPGLLMLIGWLFSKIGKGP